MAYGSISFRRVCIGNYRFLLLLKLRSSQTVHPYRMGQIYGIRVLAACVHYENCDFDGTILVYTHVYTIGSRSTDCGGNYLAAVTRMGTPVQSTSYRTGSIFLGAMDIPKTQHLNILYKTKDKTTVLNGLQSYLNFAYIRGTHSGWVEDAPFRL